jgi:membrane protein DedA with SNARE-associated domain
MENYGFLTLFILAVIPNPLVDLAGMTAGMMKYPYPKFLLAVWLGKTVKSLIFAWAGAHSINWLFFLFT